MNGFVNAVVRVIDVFANYEYFGGSMLFMATLSYRC